MTDISKERRAEMRRKFAYFLEAPTILESVTIASADLLALLDAADERDRLREAMQNWAAGLAGDLVETGHRDAIVLPRGEQSFTIDDCTFEYRPLTDEERDEIASLNADAIAKCSRENR